MKYLKRILILLVIISMSFSTFANSEGIIVLGGKKGFINKHGIFVSLPEDLPQEINVAGKRIPLNFDIFMSKGYIVYGEQSVIPGNDYKVDSEGLVQYRYLGFDANANPFSNIDFPDDINLGVEPPRKKWIENPWFQSLCKQPPLEDLSMREKALDLIQYNGEYWWEEKDINGMTWTPGRLAKHFNIQSLPGAYTPGSARGWHIYNGRTYYQTFVLMPQLVDVAAFSIDAPEEAYENSKVTVSAVAKSYGINGEPIKCKTTAAWFINDISVAKNDSFIIDGVKESSISVLVPPGGAEVKFVVNYKYDSPENECGFGYDNNEMAVNIASKIPEKVFDFEVSKILYDTYAADKNVNSIITFKNNSSNPVQNVPVRIYIKNKGMVIFFEERSINMHANSSYDIYFPFKTPDENTKLIIQADINYNDAVVETDKADNTKSIDSTVRKNFVPFGCTESRSWTESHLSHYRNVLDGLDKEGNPKYKKVPVYNDYQYTAELKGSAWLHYVADPGVTSIKSGYGFRLEAETDVTVSKQGHTKPINRINEVKKATKATVYFLGNEYPMEVESVNGNKVKFYLPQNMKSVSRARKIYIPVNTPDGTYDVTIRVEGADSSGGELCKTIYKQIRVRGNMYEDDYTSPE